jgi:hypothetical protein
MHKQHVKQPEGTKQINYTPANILVQEMPERQQEKVQNVLRFCSDAVLPASHKRSEQNCSTQS